MYSELLCKDENFKGLVKSALRNQKIREELNNISEDCDVNYLVVRGGVSLNNKFNSLINLKNELILGLISKVYEKSYNDIKKDLSLSLESVILDNLSSKEYFMNTMMEVFAELV